jgi:hypothetical protein
MFNYDKGNCASGRSAIYGLLYFVEEEEEEPKVDLPIVQVTTSKSLSMDANFLQTRKFLQTCL